MSPNHREATVGIEARKKKLRRGISVGEQHGNQDFWGIVFGRPSAYLLLVGVADVPWVTPMLLTHLSNLLVLVSAGLVYLGAPWALVIAGIVLNLSLTLDCADGQLARYRGKGSLMGSYYDKVSDRFAYLLLFGLVGWTAYQQTGDGIYIVLAMAAVAGNFISGYVKWLRMTMYLQAGKKPAPTPFEEQRSGIGLVVRVALKIFEFREPDWFLWIGLGLVSTTPGWSLWIMGLSQLAVGTVAAIYRGYEVSKLRK